MAVLSSLGVFGNLVCGQFYESLIFVGLTALLAYYSYLIKYDEITVNQSDNIELGQNNLNEKTGIFMNHNSKQCMSAKPEFVP
jgi:hypothetical protein